jgi:hypothetical protein
MKVPFDLLTDDNLQQSLVSVVATLASKHFHIMLKNIDKNELDYIRLLQRIPQH